jgi:replicative DNA helicase
MSNHVNDVDVNLPCDIDAERTILGAIMLDGQAYSQVVEKLVPNDFYLDAHRRIYARMSDLAESGRTIDFVTLSSELAKHKERDAVGGVAYLASLTEGLPRRPVISEYIQIVKDKSNLRQLMAICSAAVSQASDQVESSSSILEGATNRLQQIAEQGVSSPLQTFGSFVEQSYPSVDAVFQHSARSLGLPSGIKTLDELTCGFQRKELIVVAARPGAGKTALGLCFAAHASLDLNSTVAFFSLEMRKVALLHRLVAQRSSLNLQDIREGRWTSTTQRYALEALSEIVGAPLFIDDQKGMTVQKMKAKAARLKAQTGHLDLIVIDQLNHIVPPPGSEKYGQRRIDMGFITRSLAAMASELDAPVIVLHQLSRENEKRDNKKPRLSDLRESGSVEEDADVVLFPHRPSYYDPKADDDEKLKAEIIVSKNRNGPTGTAICEYVAEQTLFRNVEEKARLW